MRKKRKKSKLAKVFDCRGTRQGFNLGGSSQAIPVSELSEPEREYIYIYLHLGEMAPLLAVRTLPPNGGKAGPGKGNHEALDRGERSPAALGLLAEGPGWRSHPSSEGWAGVLCHTPLIQKVSHPCEKKSNAWRGKKNLVEEKNLSPSASLLSPAGKKIEGGMNCVQRCVLRRRDALSLSGGSLRLPKGESGLALRYSCNGGSQP